MTLRALAVAAFALALALHAPAAAQDSNPPPVKLGVVDMAALFDRCDARPRFERKVNALREELKQRFEVGKLELERQRAELGRLAPNDPTRETRARHLRRAIDEFETRTEAAKAELKRVADEQTVALLTRIEDAVRAYGARNGFAMIFKVTPDPKGDGGPGGDAPTPPGGGPGLLRPDPRRDRGRAEAAQRPPGT